MTQRLCVLLCAAVLFSGCDFLKKKFGRGGEEVQVEAGTTNTGETTDAPPPATSGASAVKSCDASAKVELITGVCAGSWSIGEKDGAKICEFVYSGEVRCPSEMGSFDGAVACAGSYRKKVGIGQAVEKGADCATHFGEAPKAASYELKCCRM